MPARFELMVIGELLFELLGIVSGAVSTASASAAPPPEAVHPPSSVIASIAWHWDTLRTAAPGSDCWPVAWAADDSLYTAWGDGGGFGGTDTNGRVALGFARIEGRPENYRATNVNGGVNSEHSASFPRTGKADGLIAVRSTLYAWINLQNGTWPDVDVALAWSSDGGATWSRSPWVFGKGSGRIKLSTFLAFGRACTGVPERLNGYIYYYGMRQGVDTELYLGRVPLARVSDRAAHQFFAGLRAARPTWSSREQAAKPVFSDRRGVGGGATVVYHPVLKRYLLAAFHKGPGQLAIFDGPEPWGPWTTVADYDDWGGMGHEGEGLTCTFPPKWMSSDGLTVWCVFSAYGPGARKGIGAHDRFNLVQATLGLRRRAAPALGVRRNQACAVCRPDHSTRAHATHQDRSMRYKKAQRTRRSPAFAGSVPPRAGTRVRQIAT